MDDRNIDHWNPFCEICLNDWEFFAWPFWWWQKVVVYWTCLCMQHIHSVFIFFLSLPSTQDALGLLMICTQSSFQLRMAEFICTWTTVVVWQRHVIINCNTNHIVDMWLRGLRYSSRSIINDLDGLSPVWHTIMFNL